MASAPPPPPAPPPTTTTTGSDRYDRSPKQFLPQFRNPQLYSKSMRAAAMARDPLVAAPAKEYAAALVELEKTVMGAPLPPYCALCAPWSSICVP